MTDEAEPLAAVNQYELNPVRMIRPLIPVGLLVVALCASAGPGYLPVVGPPALRFAPLPPPPSPAVLIPLPPLAVVEPRPDPSAVEPLPPATASNTTADPVSTDPFAAPPIAEPLPTAATNVPNGVPVESQPLVPQMFMKYFIGGTGTNANGVSIYPPVGFVPPLPLVPPSSSATFQTVPPGKP
jgi:hypothetical protein